MLLCVYVRDTILCVVNCKSKYLAHEALASVDAIGVSSTIDMQFNNLTFLIKICFLFSLGLHNSLFE